MEAQRKSEAKAEDKGEPGEASAEIDAGGRRKEIADETIRETACVEVERPKPPFHDGGYEKHSSLDRKAGAFLFYNAEGATLTSGSFLFLKFTHRHLQIIEKPSTMW